MLVWINDARLCNRHPRDKFTLRMQPPNTKSDLTKKKGSSSLENENLTGYIDHSGQLRLCEKSAKINQSSEKRGWNFVAIVVIFEAFQPLNMSMFNFTWYLHRSDEARKTPWHGRGWTQARKLETVLHGIYLTSWIGRWREIISARNIEQTCDIHQSKLLFLTVLPALS